MKKKNIGFILLGVAGADLIYGLVSLFIFPQIYERIGIPTNQIKIIQRISLIISLVSILALVIVGIILLIKFRNEE
ncbi:MAG: hypothetical protein ACFFCE_17025 [Promethearchaeota archaeon]